MSNDTEKTSRLREENAAKISEVSESLPESGSLREIFELLIESGRAGMQVAPDRDPSSGGGRPIRIVRPVDESEARRKLGLDKSSKK